MADWGDGVSASCTVGPICRSVLLESIVDIAESSRFISAFTDYVGLLYLSRAFIATQLNSTSSCRHVHNVNNCHRSVLNVVTQLTQFVGHVVIYDVFSRVCREMEF